MSNINFQKYPILSTYAILAQSGISNITPTEKKNETKFY